MELYLKNKEHNLNIFVYIPGIRDRNILIDAGKFVDAIL